MSMTAEAVPLTPTPGTAPKEGVAAPRPRRGVLKPWVSAQSINVMRHATALRPFRSGEFGSGDVAPSEGHVQAANQLIAVLRSHLLRQTRLTKRAAEAAIRQPTTPRLQRMVREKERAHTWVRAVEKIWDFYFELFGQRQSMPYGEWLLSCDRIALDCYQVAFMGIGKPKSIPAPPPFSYMRTGFSPATFRRGIPLRRLGHSLNPFPLVELPYHRLVNPWTLGAILHEISHNLQSDLGLNTAVPKNIARRLLDAGFPASVAKTWTRWNRETFADLSGLLLGGPQIVPSLMDVIGRGPGTVTAYSPRGPHPTPYIRTYISIELLRRMGFPQEAEQYRRAWSRIYPTGRGGSILPAVLRTFPQAIGLVVDTICYQPYPELGGKSLAQVMCFTQKNVPMIEEAARRMAAGVDPGIVPERFLIGAARFALDNKLARPGVIHKNFYAELARR